MFQLIKKNLKGMALIYSLLAPLLMLIEVFMDLQQPRLMANIVDIGVQNRDSGYILSTGFKMVLCAFAGLIGGAGCGVIASFASMMLAGSLREELFHKIQSLSYTEIDHFKTSSLITRLTNDVTQIQNMFLMLLRGMVRSPLLCIGGIFMSFLLSPSLSIVFFIILPILITCVAFVMMRSVPLYTQMQFWLDKVNTVMRENLLGVRVIKAFNLEDKQNTLFSNVNTKFTEKSIRAQNLTFTLMPIATLVMNLSVVAILWFGGNMVVSENIETGKIMAFVNYLVQITNSLIMLVNMIINISRAQASAGRIKEVLVCEASIKECNSPVLPKNYDIEFKNVSFRYGESGEYVLKDLSFLFKEGQTVGIIGATGSGKSSVVSLIPRLYEATCGQVLIGGCDVKDMPVQHLRSSIGVVLQENILFHGTVKENMNFGNEEADEAKIWDGLQAAQAEDFIQALPYKLQSQVEQRGKNFSGGQKQRLSIARTLLKKPKILIFDDSTSAVDLSTEARLQFEIAKKMKENTVIVIAQRISGVMDADTILMLDHGSVIAKGTHKELLQSNEVYRNIAVSQLGKEVLLNATE
ncbi:Lipid A export ATP-binding/permease protein MsbA [Methanosarcina barkeri str. Wiesmoor]|uniref:Lipid A export ATP-binding/permease protein MsbA n=2 Tax=Methanosarcina barkeri TaxID=2208 RepID=A0A0E3LLH7_METBA|nr:ABC transporter ATP-binding protein [Methanosarcina barkeri]AKB51291.1 Lipid A export ATP-binding/permease protein MsbA [Methanosarcina barkeri str. Wiesmoor]